MTFEITDQEGEILREMLEAAHKGTIHELHHADASEYRRMLKDRLRIIETLISRLTGAYAHPA